MTITNSRMYTVVGIRYKQLRPFLLAGVIIIALAGFGLWAYTDFTSPPHVKQPEFTLSQVSNQQRTDAEKAAYSVPPTHPRSITIKRIGVSANIVPLSTLKNGALDTPKVAWDVGWYASSAVSGARGVVLLDGHVNNALHTPGVFYNLHTLINGDRITIDRGDRKDFTYIVKQVEQLPTEKVNMNKVMTPAGNASEGLAIITCGGSYDKAKQTYSDRVIIRAVRVLDS